MDDTLYHMPERIDMLKQRAERCVCKYCGSKLKLRQIFFSEIDDIRIEIFCKKCNRIEFGVEPEIYQSAEYFVEQTGYNIYPDLDYSDRVKQMNIAKVCEIMNWTCQNLGFSNSRGFTVPVDINKNIVGNYIVLKDDDLEKEESTV